MSKHYRYQIPVKVPGGKETLTDIVCSSQRQAIMWISDHEAYEGQYTYQKFTGSIPERVLSDDVFHVKVEERVNDPLHPATTLLIKLGSIVVHAEEFIDSWGHEFDRIALEGLLSDPEYKQWAAEMNAMAFLPVKRH